MNKRFLAILAICVAVFVGLLFFNNKDAEAPTDSNATPTNHTQGSDEATVTLTEYGDFQCPACGGYYPILKQVKQEYGDKLKFQFRHFPIVGIHPNAMAAHRAAEAAAAQNKFWEMHDLLYERQSAWSSSNNAAPIFEGYAQELGLDMEAYKKDLVNPETKATIDADIAAGNDANVSSTPTFLIDGKKIDNNPRDVDGFKVLIDEALSDTSN